MFSKQAVNWEIFEILRLATRILIEILEKNLRILWSSNFLTFQDEILIEEFLNELHMTGWRLRLATRILNNILEKFHKTSVVI